MKSVLITGMTAPQASANANKRNLSFAGLMAKTLYAHGNRVVMKDPDLLKTHQDLEEFDAILVGVAPITSVSASKSYGALDLINKLWGDDRLTLFIDAPKPSLITASLRSIMATPENLVKPFYSMRRGYQAATQKETFDHLMSAVTHLSESEWPDTLYPRLPWTSEVKVAQQLPEKAEHALQGINLDAFTISDKEPARTERVNRWSVDNNTTPWTKKISLTTRYPIEPMKQSRYWDDSNVEEQLAHSAGALMSPDRAGVWWSYRFMQAMNTGTPIATEWRESCALGGPWSVLPTAIEDMGPEKRFELSLEQTVRYMAAIPDKNTAMEILEAAIGLQAINTTRRLDSAIQ